MGAQVIWLIIIGTSLVCGFIAYLVADEKGQGGTFAFWLGFLFNVGGVLYAVGMPESVEKKIEHALAIDLAIAKQRAEIEKKEEAEREYARRKQEQIERVKAERAQVSVNASGPKERSAGTAVRPIETSLDKVTCPLCGTEQHVPRSVCLKCGVKFIE